MRHHGNQFFFHFDCEVDTAFTLFLSAQQWQIFYGHRCVLYRDKHQVPNSSRQYDVSYEYYSCIWAFAYPRCIENSIGFAIGFRCLERYWLWRFGIDTVWNFFYWHLQSDGYLQSEGYNSNCSPAWMCSLSRRASFKFVNVPDVMAPIITRNNNEFKIMRMCYKYNASFWRKSWYLTPISSCKNVSYECWTPFHILHPIPYSCDLRKWREVITSCRNYIEVSKRYW